MTISASTRRKLRLALFFLMLAVSLAATAAMNNGSVGLGEVLLGLLVVVMVFAVLVG